MLLPFLLISLFLFLMGAVIGSFLNVVIYRTVTEESWIHGRSKCDNCKVQIYWYDNLPILSYLFLKGKCRSCEQPISLSYPVVEFLTGVLFVWWYWGGSLFFQLAQAPYQTLQPLFWLIIGVLLLIIVVADALYLIIPDILVALLTIVTVIYRLALVFSGIMQPVDFLKALLGMVGGVVFIGGLWWFTKGKGMGFGDVKLIVPLTLLVGWPNAIVMFFLAFMAGAIAGLGLIVSKQKKFGQAIPFGPFLIIGCVLSLIWGDGLMSWYIGLL